MDATRPNVSNHGSQARGELVLGVQVPLRHIVALGAGVRVGLTQFVGRERRQNAVKKRMCCYAVACRRSDRKSTRLNSSHPSISYAVFCLKKKKNTKTDKNVTQDNTNRSLLRNVQ